MKQFSTMLENIPTLNASQEGVLSGGFRSFSLTENESVDSGLNFVCPTNNGCNANSNRQMGCSCTNQIC